ncbi:MAG: FKBP-type peptidyl-prolyl cis-trans isomerase [Propionibacteriaceae bacterium]|jgi:peptidylprolyl isomerase|nr:FKBP-type peptidyl-prolyl cis-trans isomerase [Propionibacteriaceae bacterium]
MTRKSLIRVMGCVTALGVTLTLASCSGPGTTTTPAPAPTATTAVATPTPTDPVASDLPTAPVAANLDDITVTGGIGESPTVTVPFPWTADITRTKVLVPGDGMTVPENGLVEINYYGVNARTGEKFDDSYSRGSSVSMSLANTIPGFGKGLTGQQVGSRVLVAIPGTDAYDPSGGQTGAGIEVGDTLLFVVDILRTSVTGPAGETQPVTDTSLPTVSGDLAAPVVTIASGATPPGATASELLVKGAGPAVESTDGIYVNYAEYLWDGTLVRTTYGSSPLTGLLSNTLKAWQGALVGQTVGSRLLIVGTPEDTYPIGNDKVGIAQGSTMVYVIDILYAAPQWWSA